MCIRDSNNVTYLEDFNWELYEDTLDYLEYVFSPNYSSAAIVFVAPVDVDGVSLFEDEAFSILIDRVHLYALNRHDFVFSLVGSSATFEALVAAVKFFESRRVPYSIYGFAHGVFGDVHGVLMFDSLGGVIAVNGYHVKSFIGETSYLEDFFWVSCYLLDEAEAFPEDSFVNAFSTDSKLVYGRNLTVLSQEIIDYFNFLEPYVEIREFPVAIAENGTVYEGVLRVIENVTVEEVKIATNATFASPYSSGTIKVKVRKYTVSADVRKGTASRSGSSRGGRRGRVTPGPGSEINRLKTMLKNLIKRARELINKVEERRDQVINETLEDYIFYDYLTEIKSALSVDIGNSRGVLNKIEQGMNSLSGSYTSQKAKLEKWIKKVKDIINRFEGHKDGLAKLADFVEKTEDLDEAIDVIWEIVNELKAIDLPTEKIEGNALRAKEIMTEAEEAISSAAEDGIGWKWVIDFLNKYDTEIRSIVSEYEDAPSIARRIISIAVNATTLISLLEIYKSDENLVEAIYCLGNETEAFLEDMKSYLRTNGLIKNVDEWERELDNLFDELGDIRWMFDIDSKLLQILQSARALQLKLNSTIDVMNSYNYTATINASSLYSQVSQFIDDVNSLIHSVDYSYKESILPSLESQMSDLSTIVSSLGVEVEAYGYLLRANESYQWSLSVYNATLNATTWIVSSLLNELRNVISKVLSKANLVFSLAFKTILKTLLKNSNPYITDALLTDYFGISQAYTSIAALFMELRSSNDLSVRLGKLKSIKATYGDLASYRACLEINLDNFEVLEEIADAVIDLIEIFDSLGLTTFALIPDYLRVVSDVKDAFLETMNAIKNRKATDVDVNLLISKVESVKARAEEILGILENPERILVIISDRLMADISNLLRTAKVYIDIASVSSDVSSLLSRYHSLSTEYNETLATIDEMPDHISLGDALSLLRSVVNLRLRVTSLISDARELIGGNVSSEMASLGDRVSGFVVTADEVKELLTSYFYAFKQDIKSQADAFLKNILGEYDPLYYVARGVFFSIIDASLVSLSQVLGFVADHFAPVASIVMKIATEGWAAVKVVFAVLLYVILQGISSLLSILGKGVEWFIDTFGALIGLPEPVRDAIKGLMLGVYYATMDVVNGAVAYAKDLMTDALKDFSSTMLASILSAVYGLLRGIVSTIFQDFVRSIVNTYALAVIALADKLDDDNIYNLLASVRDFIVKPLLSLLTPEDRFAVEEPLLVNALSILPIMFRDVFKERHSDLFNYVQSVFIGDERDRLGNSLQYSISGIVEKLEGGAERKAEVISSYLSLMLCEDDADLVIFVDEKLPTKYWDFEIGDGVSEDEALAMAEKFVKDKLEDKLVDRDDEDIKKRSGVYYLDAAQFKTLIFGKKHNQTDSGDVKKIVKVLVKNRVDKKNKKVGAVLSVFIIARWRKKDKDGRWVDTYRVFQWDGEFVTVGHVISKRGDKIFMNTFGISGVYRGFDLVQKDTSRTARLRSDLKEYNFEVSNLFTDGDKPLKQIVFGDRVVHRLFFIHTPKRTAKNMADRFYGFDAYGFEKTRKLIEKITQEKIENDDKAWASFSELARGILGYLKSFSDASNKKGLYVEALAGLLNTIATDYSGDRKRKIAFFDDAYFVHEMAMPALSISWMLRKGMTVDVKASEIGVSEEYLRMRTDSTKFIRLTLNGVNPNRSSGSPIWIPKEVLESLGWDRFDKTPDYDKKGSVDRGSMYVHIKYNWGFAGSEIKEWFADSPDPIGSFRAVENNWLKMRLWRLNRYNQDAIIAAKEAFLVNGLNFAKENVFEFNLPILLKSLYLTVDVDESMMLAKLGKDAVTFIKDNTKRLGEAKNWESVVRKYGRLAKPYVEGIKHLKSIYKKFFDVKAGLLKACKVVSDTGSAIKTYIIMFALINIGYALYFAAPEEIRGIFRMSGGAGFMGFTVVGFMFTDLDDFFDAYRNVRGVDCEKLKSYAEEKRGKLSGIVEFLKFLLGAMVVGFSTAAYIFDNNPASPYNFMTFVGEKLFGRELGWIFGEIIYPIIQFVVGYLASGGLVGYIINTLSAYIASEIVSMVMGAI